MHLRPTQRLHTNQRTQRFYQDEWSASTVSVLAIKENASHSEQIAYYREWLQTERVQENDQYSVVARRDYAQRATRPVSFHGQPVRAFAPVDHALSAITTMTAGQGLALVVLIALLAGVAVLWPVPLLAGIVAVLSIIYFTNFALTLVTTAQVVLRTPETRLDERVIAALGDELWPSYTILCPLYKEVAVVPQFVRAIQQLDYPRARLQVLFLTEEDDAATREAILALGLPPQFAVVTVPEGQPRTKPRACNYGLMYATGRYIVIFDAEDIPDPLQLKKAVLTFANHGPEVACVQAKLSFYNARQNLLTRWFALEYALWFNFTLPGLQWANMSLPLGGTSNHFRTALLRRLGGWDPFNVTEDCDLGLRLGHYHLRTAMVDSVTLEEANPRVRNWVRQRSRWTKGYFQTYLVHMRRPWHYLREGRLREFISLQLIIGASPATFFINPILWVLLAVYIAFRTHVAPFYNALYASPIYYLALACLVFGNFFYVYVYLIACARTQQYRLLLAIPLIMIYWLLMSVAAVKAFGQLITKPHYWEKTQHGLANTSPSP